MHFPFIVLIFKKTSCLSDFVLTISRADVGVFSNHQRGNKHVLLRSKIVKCYNQFHFLIPYFLIPYLLFPKKLKLEGNIIENPAFFLSPLPHQPIRIFNHFLNALPSQQSIYYNCIPMFLIHVITRQYRIRIICS